MDKPELIRVSWIEGSSLIQCKIPETFYQSEHMRTVIRTQYKDKKGKQYYTLVALSSDIHDRVNAFRKPTEDLYEEYAK